MPGDHVTRSVLPNFRNNTESRTLASFKAAFFSFAPFSRFTKRNREREMQKKDNNPKSATDPGCVHRELVTAIQTLLYKIQSGPSTTDGNILYAKVAAVH